MKEATWGADPLEFYGGFPSLSYDQTATYPSSLAPNATVSWGRIDATSITTTSTLSKAVLNLAFPDIDFAFLRSIYGWAALQYQAWARGTLIVNGEGEQTITLHTEGLLEFFIDGENHFGGDYYFYQKVPLVLHLKPGKHTIDLRLVRDVRSMGGIGKPTVDVTITAELSAQVLTFAPHPAILPDMVDGKLAGALGSVTVRNDGREDIFVSSVSINDAAYSASLAHPSDLRVAPGQTRPVAFAISCISDCSPDIRIDVQYGDSSIDLPYTIKQRAIHEPHKRTFLHPGGMVSYAMLRPPTTKTIGPTDTENKLPVLLHLHGAGNEADSALVRNSFDSAPDLSAWVIIPTGSTAWSGDDWHIWGLADAEAAINSLPEWLDLVDWKGPGVDTERWLVSGHSNGGQGTWYTLLHRPDKVIAAVPVSGYSSIQNYVPYDLWRPMDSSIRSLLDTSLSGYRHERLLTNAQHISIFQQHGSADGNVPVFHSRLMSQLIHQAGANSTYVELKGEDHWFDGIMTTDPLKDFYRQHLDGVQSSVTPPNSFSFVVANPAHMGTKHGISVFHLLRTGRLGKVEVSFALSEPTCSIKTSNILSLRLPAVYSRSHELTIDGQVIRLSPSSETLDLWRHPDGNWKVGTLVIAPGFLRASVRMTAYLGRSIH